jgi:hypothetical protein
MANFLKSRVNPGRISIALVLSYIIDWLVIIAAVGLGAGLAVISPNKRPFSLVNPEISYPFVNKEKVPTLYLGLYALIIPAAIIFFVAIVLVPGPTVPRSAPKSLIWQRKLWEWHTGWLGLALSLGSAFLITQGMKNLFGKPRVSIVLRGVKCIRLKLTIVYSLIFFLAVNQILRTSMITLSEDFREFNLNRA